MIKYQCPNCTNTFKHNEAKVVTSGEQLVWQCSECDALINPKVKGQMNPEYRRKMALFIVFIVGSLSFDWILATFGEGLKMPLTILFMLMFVAIFYYSVRNFQYALKVKRGEVALKPELWREE